MYSEHCVELLNKIVLNMFRFFSNFQLFNLWRFSHRYFFSNFFFALKMYVKIVGTRKSISAMIICLFSYFIYCFIQKEKQKLFNLCLFKLFLMFLKTIIIFLFCNTYAAILILFIFKKKKKFKTFQFIR